tara:strand:- start:992 stop:1150 length:159 start_codon:yes stop_codon:yes gene_type:complete
MVPIAIIWTVIYYPLKAHSYSLVKALNCYPVKVFNYWLVKFLNYEPVQALDR